MSQRDKLDEIFRAVAGQMQADFQATRRLVRHKGLKGKAAENNLVATFLRRYLPATLTIRQNAEVLSSAGDVSPECDVLLCDPSMPPLWSANDVEIVPVECLHGLVEVKSVLKPADLREAWAKTAAIKRYPKTAWIPSNRILKPVIERYGKQWEYFPTVGFVFAFTSRSDRNITDLGQAGGSSRRSRLLYCGCGCGGRGQAAGVRQTVKPRASSWRMWLRAFLALSMRSA